MFTTTNAHSFIAPIPNKWEVQSFVGLSPYLDDKRTSESLPGIKSRLSNLIVEPI